MSLRTLSLLVNGRKWGQFQNRGFSQVNAVPKIFFVPLIFLTIFFLPFVFLVVEKDFVFRGRLENVGHASIRSLLLQKTN